MNRSIFVRTGYAPSSHGGVLQQVHQSTNSLSIQRSCSLQRYNFYRITYVVVKYAEDGVVAGRRLLLGIGIDFTHKGASHTMVVWAKLKAMAF